MWSQGRLGVVHGNTLGPDLLRGLRRCLNALWSPGRLGVIPVLYQRIPAFLWVSSVSGVMLMQIVLTSWTWPRQPIRSVALARWRVPLLVSGMEGGTERELQCACHSGSLLLELESHCRHSNGRTGSNLPCPGACLMHLAILLAWPFQDGKYVSSVALQ